MSCVTTVDPNWLPQLARPAHATAGAASGGLATSTGAAAGALAGAGGPSSSSSSSSSLSSLPRSHPLLKTSEALASPQPAFDRNLDCVVAFVVPKFGVHMWSLKAVPRPLGELGASEEVHVRWFAR